MHRFRFTAIQRLCFALLVTLSTATTIWAHPGHPGHEDGEEFVWTMDHLRRYPFATALGALFILGLIWGVKRLWSVRTRIKADASHSPSAEKLS